MLSPKKGTAMIQKCHRSSLWRALKTGLANAEFHFQRCHMTPERCLREAALRVPSCLLIVSIRFSQLYYLCTWKFYLSNLIPTLTHSSVLYCLCPPPAQFDLCASSSITVMKTGSFPRGAISLNFATHFCFDGHAKTGSNYNQGNDFEEKC